jgi:hypothetical protein
LSIPLNHLIENLEKLPKDRPLLVYCAGGYRSSIAASLLQSRGFRHVSEIASGIVGWEAANLPEALSRFQRVLHRPIDTTHNIGMWEAWLPFDLGSKRLQLNKGGGATPFLLRDLDCGDSISAPTAHTIHCLGCET